MERVVVAMSGGVDSSVTAALLKKESYEVIGATMGIWPSTSSSGGCCGLGAIEDAKKVARILDIRHYTLNFRDIFAEKVVANFCEEYRAGRTPNPCIRCNQYIKFDALLKRVKELGADYIATGHYARIEYDRKRKRCLLKKGIDLGKDQSYVLYLMTQDQLKHTLMPLGDWTKERVRQVAQELELPVATKPESQDICFVPDDNYGKFVQEYIPEVAKPGPILDREGNVLGEHQGILFYTIGQRKRLGISAKEPLYVTSLDNERNAVIVGPEREIYADELIATEVNYVSIDGLTRSITASTKIRYQHREAEALVVPLGNAKVRVKFRRPQKAITPGQAAVFYNGDTLIGGGTISERR